MDPPDRAQGDVAPNKGETGNIWRPFILWGKASEATHHIQEDPGQRPVKPKTYGDLTMETKRNQPVLSTGANTKADLAGSGGMAAAEGGL